MDQTYVVVIVASGVVLLTVTFLLRHRLSRVTFRFWQATGEIEARDHQPPPQRGQFRFSRNKLKRGSRFSVPESAGVDAQGNELTESTIEIRDSTYRPENG